MVLGWAMHDVFRAALLVDGAVSILHLSRSLDPGPLQPRWPDGPQAQGRVPGFPLPDPLVFPSRARGCDKVVKGIGCSTEGGVN